MALTVVVIGNAYVQKKQFYPSVVYITKSNPSMAVIYLQALIIIWLMGKLMQKLFFGELRAAEIEYAILLTVVVNTTIKYILHVIDMNREVFWENKAVFLLHIEVFIGQAALSLLAYCYFQTQDFVNASNCYEQLSTLFPEEVHYKLYYAQSLYQACLYDEAMKVTNLIKNPNYQKEYLYNFLDALIIQQSAPAEAYRKFDEIATRQIDLLRKATKTVQEARETRDDGAVKKAVVDYEDTLENKELNMPRNGRWARDGGDLPQVQDLQEGIFVFCF
ncbi:hypothetical protein V9T40_003661 [Parthenolecanium corni]|uniref:Tetratricopeptide repeat protein 30 n=1 Tax=Parthenolecanium corni TaxID=536013 RepID=A0AAN9YAB7_9HEMI